jgi:hypothetical protein
VCDASAEQEKTAAPEHKAPSQARIALAFLGPGAARAPRTALAARRQAAPGAGEGDLDTYCTAIDGFWMGMAGQRQPFARGAVFRVALRFAVFVPSPAPWNR